MFELKLDAGEVIATINALDHYSRVWVGHMSYLGSELSMYLHMYSDTKDSLQAEDLLVAMRSFFLPECAGRSAAMNLGIWNEKTNELAVCAYDMQQVIRHDWSWFCNPEGGMIRWFDTPFLRGSMPVPATECAYDEQVEPIMRIALEEEPLRLLLDALLTRQALLELRLADMMGLYTTNERVLAIARILEDFYREASRSGRGAPSDGDVTLTGLSGRVARKLGMRLGPDYRTLGLERADRNEPLTFGERCPKACNGWGKGAEH